MHEVLRGAGWIREGLEAGADLAGEERRWPEDELRVSGGVNCSAIPHSRGSCPAALVGRYVADLLSQLALVSFFRQSSIAPYGVSLVNKRGMCCSSNRAVLLSQEDLHLCLISLFD